MYKNKIGLVDSNNNLISQKQEVSLVWPYKDCVLEGGQDKEDQKKEEIFYNETLAPDEVNRLLAPKVLSNAKRFTSEGIEENIQFRDHDNLIIKGNNLLGLYSLLERFEGQIKLIYIDPPFNTGSDSFNYNDNFNHSSWLTFIKNRLEVAKKLLCDTGVIFVHIDKKEDAYLKLLLDDVFGQENFVTTITVKSNSISGMKTQHKEKTILKNKDSIHVFKKNEIIINPQYTVKETWDTHYNAVLKEKGGELNWVRLIDYLKDENIVDENYRLTEESILDKHVMEFVAREKDKIYQLVGSIPEELKKISLANPGKIVKMKTDSGEVRYALNGRRLSFLSSTFKTINCEEQMAQLLGDLWIDIDFQNTQNQGGVNFTNAKKPEQLLRRIISMVTNENDYVLDFFMGSGTTQAVAHKMNRKYIGIEQMDYIEDVSVERLRKVIEGEQGGISKEISWQGGGSFVYCELLEDNQSLITDLEQATDSESVKSILNRATKDGKLIPSVLPKDLKRTEVEFDRLTLDDQKKLVLELLDKNKLYINLSDIDDDHANVSEEDRAFTKSFYGLD